jgi:cation:H+ antiporter
MTVISLGTSLPELSLHIVGSLDILFSGVPFGITDPVTFFLGSHSAYIDSMAAQGAVSASEAASATAVYHNISGTVLGANVGSNIVQQTLVFGLVIFSSVIIADRNGFRFTNTFLKRNYLPMIATTLMTLILALDWRGLTGFIGGGPLQVAGTLTRLDGLILVTSFTAYMFYLYTNRRDEMAEQGGIEASESPRVDFLVGVLAMIAVIGSAELFLGVVELAVRNTGFSGSMIGVATVGIVSAFPEMITAITGLRNGSEGISLGTLVGSNITNPLLAIGSGALISTYAVPEPVVLWDLPADATTASILLLYIFSKGRLGNLIAAPLKALGFTGGAEKLRSAENRVLSVTGALLLISMYMVYLYVRFTYFS